jgi:two-component system NtrC family sensor kinase
MPSLEDSTQEGSARELVSELRAALARLGAERTALQKELALRNQELQSLNAIVKAQLDERTRERNVAQEEILATTHQAGMAEIANNVLHNVGNVLSSVNVSVSLVNARVRDSKAHMLGRAVDVLNTHSADLAQFLTHDERGKTLPSFLGSLAATLAEERQSVTAELAILVKGMEHINEIIATQQTYAGAKNLIEPVRVKDLVEDALRLNAASMERHAITVVKDCADIPALPLDKHLLLQILVNLIGNAKHAMDGVTDRAHQLVLRTGLAEAPEGARLMISVHDNGEGILPENLPRLFTHGFTTRKGGHGFGLHSCALAAHAMGGTISGKSDGRGKGAVFTLELPVHPGRGS